MLKEEIASTKAPKAVGPYSQAIHLGGLVFCSGQIAINPKTGEMVKGDIKAQTKQVLENIKGVLEAAGCDFDSVMKTTVFIQDMKDWAVMNEVYGSYFQKPYPARSTVQVAKLPKDALVEIECISYNYASAFVKTSADERGCCGGNCGNC